MSSPYGGHGETIRNLEQVIERLKEERQCPEVATAELERLRPVVEAARRFREKTERHYRYVPPSPSPCPSAEYDLWQALDALDRQEKGEL